jgi:LacI family transcriptional regulator
MRDVARMADVSLSTVSRVVSGKQVAPELAERVRRAVDMLGYRHDEVAGSLRRSSRSSSSIGLILEDMGNPFFAAIYRGAEDAARRKAVFTFAGSSDEDADQERQLAEAFLARRVDGLIVAPASSDHSYLSRDVGAGLALVFVDRPPRFIDADTVLTDNIAGARMATSYLLDAGHQRIGYVGDDPEIFTGAQRLEGYRLALGDRGLPFDPALVRHGSFRAAEAGQLTASLLRAAEPPTAIFTAQNLITIAALRTLHELGLQHAVAHVGFDDVPLGDVIEPAVTVVAQDPYEMGRQAAELLFSRLDGHTGPSRRVLLPTRLVERASGRIDAPRR